MMTILQRSGLMYEVGDDHLGAKGIAWADHLGFMIGVKLSIR